MGLDDPKISTTPPAMIGQATTVSHAPMTEIGGLARMMGRLQVSGGYASAGSAPMRRAG